MFDQRARSGVGFRSHRGDINQRIGKHPCSHLGYWKLSAVEVGPDQTLAAGGRPPLIRVQV
jgi:hypothetical protein